MAFSYEKRWKLLIDKDIMKKGPLCQGRCQPRYHHKMGKSGHVTTEVLVKICSALDFKIEDIMEIVEKDSKTK